MFQFESIAFKPLDLHLFMAIVVLRVTAFVSEKR